MMRVDSNSRMTKRFFDNFIYNSEIIQLMELCLEFDAIIVINACANKKHNAVHLFALAKQQIHQILYEILKKNKKKMRKRLYQSTKSYILKFSLIYWKQEEEEEKKKTTEKFRKKQRKKMKNIKSNAKNGTEKWWQLRHTQ